MKNAFSASVILSCVLLGGTVVAEDRPVLRRSMPTYPEIAKRMSIAGEVKVQVVVGADGKVQEAKVLSGHPMLKDAAANAAKNYVFQPGPQQSTETIDFKFSR